MSVCARSTGCVRMFRGACCLEADELGHGAEMITLKQCSEPRPRPPHPPGAPDSGHTWSLHRTFLSVPKGRGPTATIDPFLWE